MSELWQLSALDLAARIREGAVSSDEVIRAHLARIDEVNPHVNAVVRRLSDEALSAAQVADDVVASGADLGPLHGVPFTVKENIDLAGTPTTQGVLALADAVAAVDAPTVERMRAAGAIPIARTNMPDFGLRVHTDSSLHGLTRNPWSPDVTAGGSSGGEAAAIATGMSPLGLGNDIGGSLRNPAHCCGIASIKPTVGAIPMATVIPPEDQLLASQQMLGEGPMARHVADLRAAFGILAGPSPRDPRTVPALYADFERGDRVRIAVVADPPGGTTHPEIAAAVTRAADHLSDRGHEIVEVAPPSYEATIDLWANLLLTDLTVMRPLLDMMMSSEAQQVLGRLFDRYPSPTLQSAVEQQGARYAMMRSWAMFLADHPVLVTPTWAQPAFGHGDDLTAENADEIMRDTLRPVLPANLLGLPAAVVPCGTAAGLPVGVQVIGDRFGDLRCLTIAEQIEQASGVMTPIDPVTA